MRIPYSANGIRSDIKHREELNFISQPKMKAHNLDDFEPVNAIWREDGRPKLKIGISIRLGTAHDVKNLNHNIWVDEYMKQQSEELLGKLKKQKNEIIMSHNDLVKAKNRRKGGEKSAINAAYGNDGVSMIAKIDGLRSLYPDLSQNYLSSLLTQNNALTNDDSYTCSILNKSHNIIPFIEKPCIIFELLTKPKPLDTLDEQEDTTILPLL